MSLGNSNSKRTFTSYVVVAVISSLITGLVLFQFAGDGQTFAATGAVNDEPVSSAPAEDMEIASQSLIAAQPGGLMTTGIIADVAERVGRAVVNIDTKRTVKVSTLPFGDFFYEFFGMPKQDTTREMVVPAIGSGFIIRSDGYVLTNNHVVEGAKEIVVTLADGRKFDGKIMGRDSRNDLAIVKINANNLPAVQLGDSDKIRPETSQLPSAIHMDFSIR